MLNLYLHFQVFSMTRPFFDPVHVGYCMRGLLQDFDKTSVFPRCTSPTSTSNSCVDVMKYLLVGGLKRYHFVVNEEENRLISRTSPTWWKRWSRNAFILQHVWDKQLSRQELRACILATYTKGKQSRSFVSVLSIKSKTFVEKSFLWNLTKC